MDFMNDRVRNHNMKKTSKTTNNRLGLYDLMSDVTKHQHAEYSSKNDKGTNPYELASEIYTFKTDPKASKYKD